MREILQRFSGESKVPPGIYLETWRSHPIYIAREDGPLPGPPERRFHRIPPLLTLMLAPMLGSIFVMGFLVATLVSVVLLPVTLIKYHSEGGRKGILGAALVFALLSLAGPTHAAEVFPTEKCLQCHQYPLTMLLGDGTTVSLQIKPSDFAQSVHGNKLLCTACHRDILKIPHEKHVFGDRRDLSYHYSKSCTICHTGKFKEFQEGIHWRLMESGDQRAPFCADCHGAHTVTKGGVPRANVAAACAKCHPKVYDKYKNSVHGSALRNGNPDVPTCTNCHRPHSGHDPRKVAFRIDIPKLCANCHQNKAIMSKYGLPTDVVSTYLQDFHGVTISLYQQQKNLPTHLTAVCTDCHGVHDILAPNDSKSDVFKANLLATCQKCHPKAMPNFPNAWLYHYVPSPKRAVLVYYVRVFYMIFVPGMVACMLLHVGLDFFSELRHRRRKNKKKREV